jgi:plasmid stabilization system protein ParE
MPNRGAVVQARPGVRKLAHRPYHLIFHRVDESRRLVEIARFWDGRQDPSLLKME